MTTESSVLGLNSLPPDPRGDSLDVLILYDDLSAGRNAMRTVGQLTQKLHEDLHLQPVLCRFDLLEDSEWRAKAAAEAQVADILIVASSTRDNVPESLLRWLKSCLLAKRGKPVAVVALFGSSPTCVREASEAAESPAVQLVRSAVRAAGFDFFAPGAVGVAGGARFLEHGNPL